VEYVSHLRHMFDRKPFLIVFHFRDTYALRVNDLYDRGQAAGGRSLVDEDDAADLNQLPLGRGNRSFTHLADGLTIWSLC